MELLLQADLDGELSAAESARVAAHLGACAHCSTRQAEIRALSERLRSELPRFELPPALRARVAALAPAAPIRRAPAGYRPLAGFAAGFALAACLALALLPPSASPEDAVVAGHIRALQPGHLMDVASTDQHTVKPWFDGRIDFAPPVKDLAAARFPLLGGRLDYLAGHPAAVLVYGRDKHLIDLFIWPAGGAAPPGSGSRSGYNDQHWTGDGMAFWAVSDLNAKELADFVRLWQQP